eukprot:530203-Pelagomonas_calceolata.AAC.2
MGKTLHRSPHKQLHLFNAHLLSKGSLPTFLAHFCLTCTTRASVFRVHSCGPPKSTSAPSPSGGRPPPSSPTSIPSCSLFLARALADFNPTTIRAAPPKYLSPIPGLAASALSACNPSPAPCSPATVVPSPCKDTSPVSSPSIAPAGGAPCCAVSPRSCHAPMACMAQQHTKRISAWLSLSSEHFCVPEQQAGMHELIA